MREIYSSEFKFQYDNTLRELVKSFEEATEIFKFQYDNTLSLSS